MSDPRRTQRLAVEEPTTGEEILALVVADLHFDELIGACMDPLQAIGIAPDVLSRLDLLILAGDLCDTAIRNWPEVILFFRQFMPTNRIHIFEGNHDLFRQRLDQEARRRSVVEGLGAQYAQKSQIVFGNVRFLCCTLWTDLALTGDRAAAMLRADASMLDYKKIVCSDGADWIRRITPADTLALHLDHLAWLEARLKEPFAGKTIVVTHHAPTPKVMGPMTQMSHCFGSDLEDLILRHAPAAWYCGHCHTRLSARIGTTQVIEVSVGYPHELDAKGTANLGLRGLIRSPRGAPS